MNLDHRREYGMKFTDDQITQLQQLMAAAMAPVNLQLKNGDQRMANIEGSIAQNNAETTATRQASAEMLEAFNFAKRGLAFIGACAMFVGRVVTWAVKVGVPLGAAYMAIKGWKVWPWTK